MRDIWWMYIDKWMWFLGMRGHANIVSFGQNTPFIGIGSHRKIRYFLEDIQRSKFFYDARPISNILTLPSMIGTLDEILYNYKKNKQEMQIEFIRQKRILKQFNRKILLLMNKKYN